MKHVYEFRRLPALARSIPQEKFDMAEWQNECGTVACLIGHGVLGGTLTGMLMADGGPMFCDRKGVWAIVEYFGITVSEAMFLFFPDSYNGCVSVPFRGSDLFRVHHFTDREAVAARIEAFIAEHCPPDTLIEMKPERQPELVGR